VALNLPLKWQIPALSLICAATCLPGAITLYRQSQAQLSQQNEIAQKDASISADTTEALRRAERCILIDKRYPLVEGGNAYYDINSKTKRLLPTGTALCSPVSGNTAIVDATGATSDIKSAPPEQLTRILKQRGLL
jgi:hypothetical protein